MGFHKSSRLLGRQKKKRNLIFSETLISLAKMFGTSYVLTHIHTSSWANIHCLDTKKPHSLLFHWAAFRFDCGIVLTTICNSTTLISVQSCIHFLCVCVLTMGELNQSILPRGLRLGLCGGQFMS